MAMRLNAPNPTAITTIKTTGRYESSVDETGAKVEPPLDGAALPGDDLLIGADGLHSRLRAKVDDASNAFAMQTFSPD